MNTAVSFESVFFIALIIFFCLTIKRRDDEELFCAENNRYLRGLFAVLIFVFHISEKTDIFYGIFSYLSIVIVGAFFFISGYGSMKQYLVREDYHHRYLKNRISGVVIPYMIITAVYWTFSWMIGDRFSLLEVIDRMLSFAPIVTYSWFIVSIIFHYLTFCILLVICRTNRKLFASICLILMFVGIVFALADSTADRYLNAVFFSGILFAYKEKDLIRGLYRYRTAIFIAAAVLSAVLYFMNDDYSELYILSERMLFIFMLISFLCSFSFRSRFMCFLGDISFEFYLCHGITETIIRRFVGASVFVQDMLVFVSCLIVSVCFRQLFGLIRKAFNTAK